MAKGGNFMRELTIVELRTVSGGAVAVEPPGKVRIHRVLLPEQAHFDYAPPTMLRKRPVERVPATRA